MVSQIFVTKLRAHGGRSWYLFRLGDQISRALVWMISGGLSWKKVGEFSLNSAIICGLVGCGQWRWQESLVCAIEADNGEAVRMSLTTYFGWVRLLKLTIITSVTIVCCVIYPSYFKPIVILRTLLAASLVQKSRLRFRARFKESTCLRFGNHERQIPL